MKYFEFFLFGVVLILFSLIFMPILLVELLVDSGTASSDPGLITTILSIFFSRTP